MCVLFHVHIQVVHVLIEMSFTHDDWREVEVEFRDPSVHLVNLPREEHECQKPWNEHEGGTEATINVIYTL